MERTCYSCKWHDESTFGIHCRECYGAVKWEPREVNTLKIHCNSMTTTGFSRGDIRVGISLIPNIKNVIFNDPATIVFWSDGTKTVVKVQDGDEYDEEKGLAMAISKKALGNKGNYCNEFKKWLPEDEEEEEKTVELRFDTSEISKSLEGLASRIFSNKEK